MAVLKRKNEGDVDACAAGPRHSERLLKKPKVSHVRDKREVVKRSRNPVRSKPGAKLSLVADATLARMEELKAAFGEVAKALKPALAEIAERTEEIVGDTTELKENDDYQSAMKALDGLLERKKEVEASRVRLEMNALEQKRLAAEILIQQEYERRAAEIKEKMIAHIRFDMMNMAASKGDEDQTVAAECTSEYYSEKDSCFKWIPTASDEDKAGHRSYLTIAESSVRYDASIRHNAPNGAFYTEMEDVERSSAGGSETLPTKDKRQKIAALTILPTPLPPHQLPEECQRMAKLIAEDCTDNEKKLLAKLRSDDFFLTLIDAADTGDLDKSLLGRHGVKEYFKKYGRPHEHIASLP